MLEILDGGPFVAPALLVALDGWVNAGSAGTLAADAIAPDAEVVARFDSDRLYDYRMMRPTIDFQDGVLERVAWPELVVYRVQTSGRDLLVMSGPEPNWNWREFSRVVAETCRGWKVDDFVGIGGVPWAAPHTRPVTVMTTASSPELLSPWPDQPEGLLRVPGAAVSVLEYELAQSGMATIGFWARVPNYVGSAYPAAAIALIERITTHLGVVFDTNDLDASAVEHLAQLDLVIEQRPDVASMVQQLEQLHDSSTAVSGEALAAEIEKFLREER